jgi:hypothetical protein
MGRDQAVKVAVRNLHYLRLTKAGQPGTHYIYLAV